MTEQSIYQALQHTEYVVKRLNELSFFLKDDLIDQPVKILADAKSLGFPVEIEERYRNGYIAKNEETVKSIITDIQHVHIPYLERVMEDLRNALNR
jgi:hypothetical protein